MFRSIVKRTFCYYDILPYNLNYLYNLIVFLSFYSNRYLPLSAAAFTPSSHNTRVQSLLTSVSTDQQKFSICKVWRERVCWRSVEGESKWLEKSTGLVVPRTETVISRRIESYTLPFENEIKARLPST